MQVHNFIIIYYNANKTIAIKCKIYYFYYKGAWKKKKNTL